MAISGDAGNGAASPFATPPPPPLPEGDDDPADLETFSIDQTGLAALPLEERVIRSVTLSYNGFLSAFVRWAKQLPGFNQLPLPDRISLVQRRWMLLMPLQMAANSHPYVDAVRFCENFSLTEATAHSYRLPRVDPRCRLICRLYTQLNVTHRELLTLRAVLFLETSSAVQWVDAESIDALQVAGWWMVGTGVGLVKKLALSWVGIQISSM